MGLNRAKTAVVFLACFIDINAQADADVLVLAAEVHFFRLQELDILHRYFGHAVRATMQFLLFPRQTREVKGFFGAVLFRRWRSGSDRFYFGSGVQYLFRLFHPCQFSFGRRVGGRRLFVYRSSVRRFWIGYSFCRSLGRCLRLFHADSRSRTSKFALLGGLLLTRIEGYRDEI